jgi:hypothetical protein
MKNCTSKFYFMITKIYLIMETSSSKPSTDKIEQITTISTVLFSPGKYVCWGKFVCTFS